VISIADVTASALDLELREPFGIATGAQLVANNVLVTLTLSDGTVGIGEAAPFPAVNGETQTAVLGALHDSRAAFVGLDARRFRVATELAREALQRVPTARAAFESALLDALCRRAALSLWSFFGGAEPTLVSDITIPTGSPEDAERAARRALTNGFRTLKIKVGGAPFDHDRARLVAIAEAAPQAELVLDANASLGAEAALELLAALGEARSRVTLFEQPCAKFDFDGLRRVRERAETRVAADESACSASDVSRLIQERAVDAINIKTMKSGIVEAMNMIAVARAAGLELMIGGMVESELAMTVSACLAAGIGGFRFIDLDTPWFIKSAPLTSPVRAGWEEARGATLRVDQIERGHGVDLKLTGRR
jgi:L-alanine-DL-glutamate epimerase-like enolase superfamily enzyme